ncbi:MAG: hypothetical protein IPG45_14475 [Deltaproteobacteria bacterium]|nr:hypothetical protein [Deltaproteobacteria bacterium]
MGRSGVGLLLALSAAVDTSSTTTTRLEATGRGAALAWDLSSQLTAGHITPEELVRQVIHLHPDDRRQFLGAWEMARPELPVAYEIKARVAESLRGEPAPEAAPAVSPPPPAEPILTPEFTPIPSPTPEPYFVARPLSGRGPIAFVLSFFLGMGIGHYVLGSYLHGVISAALEIGGIAIVGATRFTDTGIAVGGSLFLVGWLSDWGGVLYYTSQAEDPVKVSRAPLTPEPVFGDNWSQIVSGPRLSLFSGQF